jgi:prefoldin subunit 5
MSEYDTELMQLDAEVQRLRAEVASLKEEHDKWKNDFMAQNGDLAESIAALRWTEQQLAAANGRVEMLRDAIENLRKVKGRHNTELACNRLFAASIRKSEG